MPCRTLSAQRFAPRLLWLGLTIVLAAQLLPGVPVAGAIAICGWGSALQAGRTWMPLVLATYVPLVGLAVAAQLHAAAMVEKPLASVDAVAAMLLAVLLIRHGLTKHLA